MSSSQTLAALLLGIFIFPAESVPGVHTTGPVESTVPLIQALVTENTPLAIALIDEGTDLHSRDVITPLYAAQEYVRNSRQRHSLLRRLLKRGARVDSLTQDGSTVRADHPIVLCVPSP